MGTPPITTTSGSPSSVIPFPTPRPRGASSPGEPEERLDAALLTPAGVLHRIALPRPPQSDLRGALCRVLGCGTLDALHLSTELHLYVDDEGLLTGQPLSHAIPSVARHFRPDLRQPVAGSAVLLGGIDRDGADRSLPAHLRERLADIIRGGRGRVAPINSCGVSARAQAIVDGDLILLPAALVARHGFAHPLTITRTLWDECVTAPAGGLLGHRSANRPQGPVGPHERQRLADLLGVAFAIVEHHRPGRGLRPVAAGVSVTSLRFTHLCSPLPETGPPVDATNTAVPTRGGRASVERDLIVRPVEAAYTLGRGIDPAPGGTLHRADETPPAI